MPGALANLVFAAPAWAWALPAVLLPLAAHLLMRGRAKVVDFPPARLVAEVAVKPMRARRLRDAALLGLRVAAIGLLVLGFMQPRWWAGARADAAPAGPGVALVIVLDRSASTQRVEAGARVFDEARRRALARLNGLEPGRDRAAVVRLDARPRALLPELTGDIDALARRVAELEVSYERAEAVPALDEAQRLLATAGARQRRVLVLTDAQATAWSAAARRRLAELGEAAAVRFVDVGASAANVAVRDVRVEPARPAVGVPTRVAGRVANHGPEAVRAAVELRVASQVVDRRAVDVDAGADAAVTFEAVFEEPGRQSVELALAGGHRDALAFDDGAGVVVDVRRALAVTLVSDADADDPATAAYHVTRALRPDGDAAAGVEVRLAGAAEALADDAAVVVIVEAGRLDDDALGALARRLERDTAGGVLWVIDDADAAASLARLGEAHGLAVPGAELDDAGEALPLGHVDFDRPPFAALHGPGRAALLAEMRMDAAVRLDVEDEADVRARLGDGRALLVAAEGGALMLWAGSLAPARSTLAGDALLVPVVHELVRELAAVAGASSRWRVGDVIELGAAERWRAARPGLHRVDDEPAAWVSVDPAESDLTRAAAPEDPAADAGAPEAAARVIELWPAALVAALGLLTVEALAAGAGGSRREGGGGDVV